MRIPVLSAAEAAAWDEAARDAHGMPSRALMEAAGRAAAHVIATAAPAAFGASRTSSALIACGPGNNGGDGWVVARALAAAGWQVWATDLDRERSPDCEASRVLALADGVERVAPDAEWPRAAVLVDALLGTGAEGAPRGPLGEMAARLAGMDVPITAIDGPSGLDLTTGQAHGPVRAALTITFGGVRRGHLLARDWCGDLVTVDIGFPPPDAGLPLLTTDAWAAAHVPSITSAMHKGDRGKILVVGGAAGMAGAAMHVARGAFAAGAGLVKLVVPQASVAAVQANLPDALTTTWEDVDGEMEWPDAVVLGPGLGRGVDATAMVRRVLAQVTAPVVVDADALHVPHAADMGEAPRVLTPHPGEFAAQFPEIARDDPFAAPALALASCRATSALLLKGVPTVVAGRSGPTWIVARGNPGLATGGSGDLLAGLIAAMLARGVPPHEAAALGAHVFGRAAELAADAVSVRAMRPEDVAECIPAVWEALASPPAPIPPVLDVLPVPVTA